MLQILYSFTNGIITISLNVQIINLEEKVIKDVAVKAKYEQQQQIYLFFFRS